MKNKEIPSLALAYLGDSVYEVYIREYLLSKGICHVNDLQKEATNFVSAKNQTKFLNSLVDNNILTEAEITIVTRARNQKSNHKPKNTDIITYKYSTGFEALIGYLYINNKERLEEIINIILKED
ncbi:MAG: Mini-ribonuclease 3 [Bacilli bacterium]|nr:Mini-ribonuclease 3 [Bacilli bacterium]